MSSNIPTHPLGHRLLGEVDDLVTWLRGSDLRRFDFDRTAAKASVSVIRSPLQPGLQGLTLGPDRVVVNSELRGALANFTLAHELAHAYHLRGFFTGLSSSEEEWFADWFAREMLLPRAWLNRRWVGQGFARYGVDWLTAALQLAVTGRAPAIMRYGDRVLCRVCGTRHHRWGCECAGPRCAPKSERARLPEARDVIADGRRSSRTSLQLSMLRNAFPAQPVEARGFSLAAVTPR